MVYCWRVCERCCRLRVAGMHGVQGIVLKTVSDDLQCDIWKPTHMNKIIPSLLVNLHDEGLDDDVLASICYVGK